MNVIHLYSIVYDNKTTESMILQLMHDFMIEIAITIKLRKFLHCNGATNKILVDLFGNETEQYTDFAMNFFMNCFTKGV